jgi:prepilin-type N-terminal cleavage/methylation domain-containing protein
MKRRQGGFTLTEMMVVVAIIGVLVTMAIVYMRNRSRPIDVATRIGDLVREGSRRAVALGPVRSNVAVALGTKARTQVTATASTTAGVTTVTFTLWRLQEDPLPTNATGTWVPISLYATDRNVTVESWSRGAVDHTAAARTTDWSAWSATPPPLQCRPDGTCDAVTVFLQASLPGPSCDPTVTPTGPLFEQCARVSVMQLGGAIYTRTDWN